MSKAKPSLLQAFIFLLKLFTLAKIEELLGQNRDKAARNKLFLLLSGDT